MLRFEETVENAEATTAAEGEDVQVDEVQVDDAQVDDAQVDEVQVDEVQVDEVQVDEVQVDDAPTVSAEQPAVQESPTGAAARMLEVAAVTAEEIVAIAQAHAEAILEASRQEAHEAEVKLDQERTTALAGLAEEKAELESQITTLRSLHDDHRSQMRRHLTQQLELLDDSGPEPTAHVG